MVAPVKRRRHHPPRYPELGALIRDRRLELGLSQVFVAEQIGVYQSTLSTWESGRRTPSGPAFERLRQFLRFTDAELKAAIKKPV